MSAYYDRLAKILTSGFGVSMDEVSPDATFSELELDSLALVELTLAVQEEFGLRIGDEDIQPEDTLSQAAGIIEAKGAAA